MPYIEGHRLPGERASRLGHLEVIKSDLVNKLCSSFEDNNTYTDKLGCKWQNLPTSEKPLDLVFGIDGSLQVIQSDTKPTKTIAFIKTSLLRLDQVALMEIDKEMPHPFALRDILADSALYHATVLPLKHIRIRDLSLFDAVRGIIYESMRDSHLADEPFQTLKWIVFEKWDKIEKNLPEFECPNCGENKATLPFDADEGSCPNCNGHLYLTDMLGFHQEMGQESAPKTVATAYMSIHETMMLFTGIRYFWENKREMLKNCLFVKDGPLSIRAQYSKLVAPIRRFLAYSRDKEYPVHILGQEKTGAFAEHLELINADAPIQSIFIPGDHYIKEQIQHRPTRGAPYGKDTNYGAKIFTKYDQYHHAILNIPTGEYVQNPTYDHLIGANKILSTLPTILGSKHEGSLLPIELAHGVASLSTYPSAHILKVFADSHITSA